jgi:hypothetical protein
MLSEEYKVINHQINTIASIINFINDNFTLIYHTEGFFTYSQGLNLI